MTTLFQPYQLRGIAYGVLVTKAAQNLPQTATATLFTVATGNVLVTGLLGIVSGTAIQNQACTLALGTAPTTGTAKTTGIATAVAITNSEIGVMLSMPITSGGALQVAGASGAGANAGAVVNCGPSIMVAPGTITWTTSASNTGKIAWYLLYVPLDTGATVS